MADSKISQMSPKGGLDVYDLDQDFLPVAKNNGVGGNRKYSLRDILMAFQLLADPFNQYRLKVDDSSNTTTTLSIVDGVVTVDLSLGDYYTLSLDANVTSVVFINPPGAGKGCSKFIEITQTGTFTFDFPAIFHWEGGSEGTISGTSGMVDVLAITTLNNATSFHATLSNDRKVA